MAKKVKLPKGMHQKDSAEGNSKLRDCPNCIKGKIGGKDCIACNGRGKRWQRGV